jgi:16S rRNA (uracil1498-N3)-methyltransferase
VPEHDGTSAFYIPSGGLDGQQVEFDPGESAHIARVLRLTAGEVVEALDGRGGVYRVELTRVDQRRTFGRVLESRNAPEQSPAISVALSVGRKERLRFAVEKLAELGCARFWPLDCEFLQFPGSLGSQIKKLEGSAVAALKQSRRPFLTAIEKPLRLDGLLGLCNKQGMTPVFCQPGGGEAVSPEKWAAGLDSGREFVLVVGPEGGFSAREAELIESSGGARLSLGDCWLRSETAAVVGFSLLVNCLRGEYTLS